jgi:hypothetical protein
MFTRKQRRLSWSLLSATAMLSASLLFGCLSPTTAVAMRPGDTQLMPPGGGESVQAAGESGSADDAEDQGNADTDECAGTDGGAQPEDDDVAPAPPSITPRSRRAPKQTGGSVVASTRADPSPSDARPAGGESAPSPAG